MLAETSVLRYVFCRAAVALLLPFSCAAGAAASDSASVSASISYPDVVPGRTLTFPADHGSHPSYRTEWWYVTGWLRPAGEAGNENPLGFQVTFFRARPAVDPSNPSRFAPKQLIFAHAAISDPATGRLLHDQRIARAGFGLAGAAVADSAGDFEVRVDRWTMHRDPRSGVFHAHIAANDFSLDLELAPQQAELLQGSDDKTPGYSRKGPNPLQASYYYSLPHLAVSGRVERGGRSETVQGSAWFDHEWSTAYLDPRAAGWDWVGLNLDDGSALMAFRIRKKKGGTAESKTLWAGGALRRSDGRVERYSPGDVHFETLRSWTSPRTGTEYPVEQRISIEHAGIRRSWRLAPLFDDQELDSRASTGTIYWEGAVRALGEGDASASPAGRGYLELTGYQQPLKF